MPLHTRGILTLALPIIVVLTLPGCNSDGDGDDAPTCAVEDEPACAIALQSECLDGEWRCRAIPCDMGIRGPGMEDPSQTPCPEKMDCAYNYRLWELDELEIGQTVQGLCVPLEITSDGGIPGCGGIAGEVCPEDLVCDMLPLCCDMSGPCLDPAANQCPRSLNPVCAGQTTFANWCAAQVAGYEEYETGACEADQDLFLSIDPQLLEGGWFVVDSLFSEELTQPQEAREILSRLDAAAEYRLAIGVSEISGNRIELRLVILDREDRIAYELTPPESGIFIEYDLSTRAIWRQPDVALNSEGTIVFSSPLLTGRFDTNGSRFVAEQVRLLLFLRPALASLLELDNEALCALFSTGNHCPTRGLVEFSDVAMERMSSPPLSPAP